MGDPVRWSDAAEKVISGEACAAKAGPRSTAQDIWHS
jgi:hypothetical protein